MAKILCSISGIEFDVPYFNLYLQSPTLQHPIFNVSAPKLLDLIPNWIDQKYSPAESYLLYIALFKSTGLMEFRVPATIGPDTLSTIAQNMVPLAEMVEKILDASDARKQDILHLPTIVITPDTKDFSDSKEWIALWNQCYGDYVNRYQASTLLEKLQRKETILERHIKDRTKDIATYAHQLASWAAMAGKFPEFPAGLDSSILNGAKLTLSEYWQHIIKCCAKTESIWDIPDADIQELIEHCEDTIEHGSIYANKLMELLRSGMKKKSDFFSIGNIDIGNNGASIFRILDGNASIEDANKLAVIDSAPIAEPKESDYPNKLAYIKAKMSWKMATEYKKGLEGNNNG